jgi:hypothetical protein
MSEGRSSAQRPNQTLRRHQLEVIPMFKKILLSAAALSGLFLFASQAEAGYGYGYSYGHKHYKPYYRSYSYHKPHCYTVTKPVTIRVWDDYSYSYFYKTIYRDYRICN